MWSLVYLLCVYERDARTSRGTSETLALAGEKLYIPKTQCIQLQLLQVLIQKVLILYY
jgi:hypothetical protein